MRLLSPLLLLTLFSAIPVFAVPISGEYRINLEYQGNSMSYSFNLNGIEFARPNFHPFFFLGTPPYRTFSNDGPTGQPIPFSFATYRWESVRDSTGPSFPEWSIISLEWNTAPWEGGTVSHQVDDFFNPFLGEVTSRTLIDSVEGATAPISGKFSVEAVSGGRYNPILTPLVTEQGRTGLFSGTFTGTATISGFSYLCFGVNGGGGPCGETRSNLRITFSGDLIEDTYVPEPATYGSIGVGLGFLCWFRSRIRRA